MQARGAKSNVRRRKQPVGQAMVEYVSITAILTFGALAFGLGWPVTRILFEALQTYIDFYFYALNLALG